MQAALHHLGHIDRGLQAALHRDGDMAAIFAKTVEVARYIVACDHVEHQLYPLAAGNPGDFGDEILRLVINRVVRPDLQRGGAFFGPAAGNDHSQSEGFPQHDRH